MTTLLELPTATIEWALLSPLIVLLGVGCLGIVLEAVVPRSWRYLTQTALTAVGLIVALGLTILDWVKGEMRLTAEGLLALDGPTYVFWSLLLIVGLGGTALFAERQLGGGQSAFAASASTVPGSPLEREAERLRREHTEVFPLLVFAIFGMMLFVAANNLLVLFVAVEILSLPLYLLTGMARRRRLLSQEASLKYFLLGALSSAIFLFGIALVYAFTGSFNLGAIAQAVAFPTYGMGLLYTGMVLLAAGLLFKIGVVPFHNWTPDVYVGAPTPVTGFMAIATKMVAVLATLRVFYVALGGDRWDWQPVLATLAVLSMVVGALAGLTQRDVKRMLAYSSIAHAGFLLTAIIGATQEGVGPTSVASVLFYLVAYGFATIGAFGLITMVRNTAGEDNSFDGWAGLGKKSPVVAGLMSLFLLSFAGIPLTAGFIGKWTIFAAAWRGGYSWLVVVAVLVSLVAAYFYLRLIAVMFGKAPAANTFVSQASGWTWFPVLVSAAATVVLGIAPDSLLSLTSSLGIFLR